MTLSVARAVKDIVKNGYLNAVAVVTIAMSILVVSSFGLFILNANDIIAAWISGIRIMAYLKANLSSEKIFETELKIKEYEGVQKADFISKEQALVFLKEKMKGQSSLLGDLAENPLPDSFEISLNPSVKDIKDIETLAKRIKSIEYVTDVEYGQVWLKRFANILNLFRVGAFGIGCVFFLASVFIIGNTIRLVLYSRREEIEIMRLVGASESFIKIPFYIEGLILGAFGGLVGLIASFLGFISISSNITSGASSSFFKIRFFPMDVSLGIILCSIFVGWLGCYLSLKQFLKKY